VFRSLQSKLILAFVLIALTGILILAGVLYSSTTARFDDYVFQQGLDEVVHTLARYYRMNGTLQGYRDALFPAPNRGGDWHRFDPNTPPNVTDPYGNQIDPRPATPRMPPPAGDTSPARKSIVVDGELVGYVLVAGQPVNFNRFDQEFLARLQETLWQSAIGAVAVALVLGLLLARSLTGPIKELNRATRAMADGDLVQRVTVRSRDELGQLAASFNVMNERLERMLEQREQMTADIAHELRTPLSVILGHTAAGKDGVLPVDETMINVIDDEARRLERLVEDLRTLSLADGGDLKLDRTQVSIRPLLERCASAFQPAALEKHVGIHVQVADDVPDVLLDPLRMEQVLDNLLENALRYSAEGSMIHLSAFQEKGNLRIEVADSGEGIPSGELEHVFDRLYRVEPSRTRTRGGSGLGLAIVKSLVESHGGSIHAESMPGSGATFIIQLPLEGE